jgi:hypothetical protein
MKSLVPHTWHVVAADLLILVENEDQDAERGRCPDRIDRENGDPGMEVLQYDSD